MRVLLGKRFRDFLPSLRVKPEPGRSNVQTGPFIHSKAAINPVWSALTVNIWKLNDEMTVVQKPDGALRLHGGKACLLTYWVQIFRSWLSSVLRHKPSATRVTVNSIRDWRHFWLKLHLLHLFSDSCWVIMSDSGAGLDWKCQSNAVSAFVALLTPTLENAKCWKTNWND